VLESEPLEEHGVVLSRALDKLAEAYSRKGEIGVAIELRVRAADIGRQVYSDDKRIADLDFALAADKARISTHRDDAYVLLVSLLDRYRDLGSMDRVALALRTLGRLHRRAYRHAAAVECFEEQHSLLKDLHGDRSAEVAASLAELGSILVELGTRAASDRALRVLEQAYAIRTEVLAPAHPDLAHTANAINSLRRSLGIPGRIA